MAHRRPAAEILDCARWKWYLAGTGGCSAFDVVLILKKGAAPGQRLRCEPESRARRHDPKVFTNIHFHYRVKGKQLKPDAVARAIELSKDKYCSASIMIGKTAEITYDFEIIEEA
jgi:putative redox protein